MFLLLLNVFFLILLTCRSEEPCERQNHVGANGLERHDTRRGKAANCRNRTMSLASRGGDASCSRAEKASLLRGKIPMSDDDDEEASAAQPTVPSDSALDGPSASDSAADGRSNNVRRRWMSLRRWFSPGCSATPAIGLLELRSRRGRTPVRTDGRHTRR